MDNNADIIKEFLVAIGFRLDESSVKKFGSQMGDIGKRVAILGTTLVVAAAAIETFVTKMASGMEDLYWSSQRLRSSVSQIQDYALGIQNLGGSAEGAKSSLENLARLIRTNPGYASLVGNLGVNPNQGTVGMMEQLGRQFSKMPYFIANQYASRLGIDEQTLWAIVHGKGHVLGAGAGKGGDTYSGLYKAAGLNANDAARASKDFMVQIRLLEAEFKVLAQVLMYTLLPAAKEITKWGQDFIKITTQQISDGGKLREIFKNLKPVAHDLVEIAAVILKISMEITSVLSGMPKESLEYGFIGYILFGKKAAIVIAALGMAYRMSEKLGNILGFSSDVNSATEKEAGEGTGSITKLNRWLYNHGLGALAGRGFNEQYGSYLWKQQNGAYLSGVNLNEKSLLGLIRKLEGSGDSAVSPAGAVGRYQITPATARAYGFDPARLKDPSYNTQAALAIIRNLTKKFQGNLRDILIAYNAGPGRVDTFHRSGWIPDETRKYLSNATKEVTIHQKNDYHINGGDSKEVSGLVSDAQKDSNAIIVRNMKGALE